MNTLLSANKPQLEAALDEYGVTKALVFGSFARGEATPDSDLDLLVTYRNGVNLFDVIALQNKLEKLLGRKVDLVSEKYLSPRLAKRIKDDIKPLASFV